MADAADEKEMTDATEPEAPRVAPENQPQGDSATFSRCAACRNAAEIDPAGGTLLCRKFNMCVNAEADEIPDDCVAHDPVDEAPEKDDAPQA